MLCSQLCKLRLDSFSRTELGLLSIFLSFLKGFELFPRSSILLAELLNDPLILLGVCGRGWLTHRRLAVCCRGSRLGRSTGGRLVPVSRCGFYFHYKIT